MLLSSACLAAWRASPRVSPSFAPRKDARDGDNVTRRGQYLAFNARQAAAAGLGVADLLAVTTAVLPGQADAVQLPLLLLVNLLHAHGFEQRPPLFGGVGLEEEAVLQVHVADVDVVIGDVLDSELVGLLRLLCAVHG